MKTLLLLILPYSLFAQVFPEKEIKTEINGVTVFLRGAQISRTGETSIPSGETVIMIKGLTPQLDDKSIQVKGKGAFTILAVNHQINYLKDLLGKDKKIDSLQTELRRIEDEIVLEKATIDVLTEKMSLLSANKKLGGDNTGVSVTQLQQAINFYETEITKIKKEGIATGKRIRELELTKNKIQNQLKEWSGKAKTPSGEIAVRVRTERATKGQFDISYIVRNAGWAPQYDIRVKDIKSPVELNYKAEVYQNTGVDWNNVRLKFSNKNPNQSGTAPRLQTWYLAFEEENNFFSEDDWGGGFSEARSAVGFADDAFEIEEEPEELAAAQFITTEVVENQTSVEFAVTIPYSVKSNGERFTVDLSQNQVEATYQYYAVPKLDRDAFLIARVVDWNRFNLLSGSANLYFEDAYVGKSYLNTRNTEDTLDLSLGRDKSIVIERRKIDQYSKKKTIGSNKIESRGFEINLRNTKNQSVALTIFDQIPISTNNEINVENLSLSGGNLNRQSGEIVWKKVLSPNSTDKIDFQYDVKYPKKKKLILE